jgi:hypothetical protein
MTKASVFITQEAAIQPQGIGAYKNRNAKEDHSAKSRESMENRNQFLADAITQRDI